MPRLFLLLSLVAVSSALPQFFPYQAAYPTYGLYPGYFPGYQAFYPGLPFYPVSDPSVGKSFVAAAGPGDQAATKAFITASTFQASMGPH
jgi:hypothetical protein